MKEQPKQNNEWDNLEEHEKQAYERLASFQKDINGDKYRLTQGTMILEDIVPTTEAIAEIGVMLKKSYRGESASAMLLEDALEDTLHTLALDLIERFEKVEEL